MTQPETTTALDRAELLLLTRRGAADPTFLKSIEMVRICQALLERLEADEDVIIRGRWINPGGAEEG